MFLEIEHRLSFDYDAFIRESFLELRMQPKTTPSTRRCRRSSSRWARRARSSRYRDWNDNAVHHFTIANFHDRIEVERRSLVRHATRRRRRHRPLADPLPLRAGLCGLHDFLELGGPGAA